MDSYTCGIIFASFLAEENVLVNHAFESTRFIFGIRSYRRIIKNCNCRQFLVGNLAGIFGKIIDSLSKNSPSGIFDLLLEPPSTARFLRKNPSVRLRNNDFFFKIRNVGNRFVGGWLGGEGFNLPPLVIPRQNLTRCYRVYRASDITSYFSLTL